MKAIKKIEEDFDKEERRRRAKARNRKQKSSLATQLKDVFLPGFFN